jgi:hypothetical protein
MRDPLIIESLRRKYQALGPTMDESLRRHWAAAEALELPRGGLSAVAEATGLSMTTIRRGVRELHAPRGALSALPLGDGFAIRAEGVRPWPPTIRPC